MHAIAYLRVSTDDQSESGNGINSQLDACRQWAKKNGVQLASQQQDDVSGKYGLDRRPGLLAALSDLSKGDVLIVAKRDRIGRDPIVVAMIEAAIARKGAKLVSVAGEGTEGDGPTDILMRRMVDAFAEYERLVIGARTKAALQSKINRGERCGEVRFGYDLDVDGVTLVANPKEQEVIEIIGALKSSGLSLRKIADELTSRRIATKKGKRKWTHTAVNRILSRAA